MRPEKRPALSARFVTSGRDQWNEPRQTVEARRHHIHGAVVPMEYPGFWQRLFGR